ncbi:hypothetical protein ACWGPD_11195 [Streptomyces hirsutus]|uniref:hypothetical protein n=1 Tax=Streptomyces hirsutus TaxID=35620 RepID=UPI00363889FB
MADKVSQQLWGQLQAGTSPSRFEEREPEADATTHALWEQAGYPGGPAELRKRQAAVRQEHREAEAEHEARIKERARKLRRDGVHLPEDTARLQLSAEDRERREKAKRRADYEAMVKSNRAEYTANSTEGLRERDQKSRQQRREENDKRLVASLLAQLRASE